MLKRELRQIMRRSRLRRRQVFLDLYGGAGGVAANPKALGYGVFIFELANGSQYDLTRPKILQLIEGWMKSYVVIGIMCATPCGSWSQARRGKISVPDSGRPLRSRQHLWGLPDLTLRERAVVDAGNATAKSTFRILRLAQISGLPSILDNPINSRLWQCPALCALRSLRDAESITLDQCRFGTPWRKRTRMLLLHCCSVHCLDRRCAGRKGLCSTTGKHHIILQGSGPGGKTWTSRAQTFPKKFADELGRILSSTAAQQSAQNLRSFVA